MSEIFDAIKQEWLHKRQQQYSKRCADFAGPVTASSTLDFHKKIVAEINALPFSEGGLNASNGESTLEAERGDVDV
jgi:hypothetical protein